MVNLGRLHTILYIHIRITHHAMELYGWFELNFNSLSAYTGTFGNNAGTIDPESWDGLVHSEVGIRRHGLEIPPRGFYDTIWMQAGTQLPHPLTLEIREFLVNPEIPANPPAFRLIWSNKNGEEFIGVGNLVTPTRMIGWYQGQL